MSEGQDELKNFEEEYYDLKIKTLEDEFTDFQVIYNSHAYIYSVSFIECVCTYLSVCIATIFIIIVPSPVCLAIHVAMPD